MLALALIALVVAAVSAVAAVRAVSQARRSADAAEASVAEARRSAGAAERAAGAATITAEADRAADHRAREPRLIVTVDKRVEYDGTEAIYRVLNDGPADLDAVVVHRPVLDEVEERIVHQVAHTGETGYEDQADLGPIRVTEYERFTLSLGVREVLPEFRVKFTCRVAGEEWTVTRVLDQARKPKPPPPPRIAKTRSRCEKRDQIGGF
jgi:hypothetical protein